VHHDVRQEHHRVKNERRGAQLGHHGVRQEHHRVNHEPRDAQQERHGAQQEHRGAQLGHHDVKVELSHFKNWNHFVLACARARHDGQRFHHVALHDLRGVLGMPLDVEHLPHDVHRRLYCGGSAPQRVQIPFVIVPRIQLLLHDRKAQPVFLLHLKHYQLDR